MRFTLKNPEIVAIQYTGGNIEKISDLINVPTVTIGTFSSIEFWKNDVKHRVLVNHWVCFNPEKNTVFMMSPEEFSEAYQPVY